MAYSSHPLQPACGICKCTKPSMLCARCTSQICSQWQIKSISVNSDNYILASKISSITPHIHNHHHHTHTHSNFDDDDDNNDDDSSSLHTNRVSSTSLSSQAQTISSNYRSQSHSPSSSSSSLTSTQSIEQLSSIQKNEKSTSDHQDNNNDLSSSINSATDTKILSRNMISPKYNLDNHDTSAYLLSQHKARLKRAQKQKQEILKGIENTKKSITQSHEQIAKLKENINIKQSNLHHQNDYLLKTQSQSLDSINSRINSISISKIPILESSMDKATLKSCKDLMALFDIRKRRKKTTPPPPPQKSSSSSSSYQQQPIIDTYIGFAIVPNFLALGQYSHFFVNTSIERIAYFCQYLAYYLHTQLPYPIALPQTSYPYVRIGITATLSLPSNSLKHSSNRHHHLHLHQHQHQHQHNYPSSYEANEPRSNNTFQSHNRTNSAPQASGQKYIKEYGYIHNHSNTSANEAGNYHKHNSISEQSLVLSGMLKDLIADDKIREFESYATGLAMLFLDLAFVATIVGVSITSNNKDHSNSSNETIKARRDSNTIISKNDEPKEDYTGTTTTTTTNNSNTYGANLNVRTLLAKMMKDRRRNSSSSSIISGGGDNREGASSRGSNHSSGSISSSSSSSNQQDNNHIDDLKYKTKSTNHHHNNNNEYNYEDTLRPKSQQQQQQQQNQNKMSGKIEDRNRRGSISASSTSTVTNSNQMKKEYIYENEQEKKKEDDEAIKILEVDKILLAIHKKLMTMNDESTTTINTTSTSSTNTATNKNERLFNTGKILGPFSSELENESNNNDNDNDDGNDDGNESNGVNEDENEDEDEDEDESNITSTGKPNQGLTNTIEDQHSMKSKSKSKSGSKSIPKQNSRTNAKTKTKTQSQSQTKSHQQQQQRQWPSVITVRDMIVTRNLAEFSGGASSSTEWNLIDIDNEDVF